MSKFPHEIHLKVRKVAKGTNPATKTSTGYYYYCFFTESEFVQQLYNKLYVTTQTRYNMSAAVQVFGKI